MLSDRVQLSTAEARPLGPRVEETGPLGPLGFKCSQHSPSTRPSVERTAEKAFLLLDRALVPSSLPPSPPASLPPHAPVSLLVYLPARAGV